MNGLLCFKDSAQTSFGMGPVLRILVVDDHDIVRRSICTLLSGQPDFQVVCDAADGLQAVREAERLQPDVVVLDITMPKMGGFEAAVRIREVAPSAEIVFLSQHDSLDMIKEAFRHGARGYVVKSAASKELVTAVRTVSKKKRYVNAKFAAHL
jgi:DNA-binding NarL/FixJ family response regulator